MSQKSRQRRSARRSPQRHLPKVGFSVLCAICAMQFASWLLAELTKLTVELTDLVIALSELIAAF